jgi:hypothetical protein
VDRHRFDVDPDPAFHSHADPDPDLAFLFNADQDLDTAPFQNDGNLQLLFYRRSRAQF